MIKSSSATQNQLIGATEEILTIIFLNLKLKDIQSCLLTSKQWSAPLQNPLFLHQWLHIHHPPIYSTCEILISPSRHFYQKNFLAAKKQHLKITRIKSDQNKIFHLYLLIIAFSMPILLPLALYFAKKTLPPLQRTVAIIFSHDNLRRIEYIARLTFHNITML